MTQSSSDIVRQTEKELRNQLATVYTPSEPITDPRLFSGREELLKSLEEQMSIRGKVFILYGERGVGKTSFFNVLLHGSNYVKYNCTEADNFLTIFLNILVELGLNLTEVERSNLLEGGYEIGADGIFKAGVTVQTQSKQQPIGNEPLDQAGILRRLKAARSEIEHIVFDEVQKLQDPKIHDQMRSLVKAMSDFKIGLRIFFVGIADSDEDLIPPDPDYSDYKIRHFSAARIPPMTAEEIKDILDRRRNFFNIKFDPTARDELANIATGFPSIAHSIALYSCFGWLGSNIGKFIKNWALKFRWLKKWLAPRGVNLEKIEMTVSEENFAYGVNQFLMEFNRNYERHAHQLKQFFDQGTANGNQSVLLSLAQAARRGLPAEKFSVMLRIEKGALHDFVQERCDRIVEQTEDKYWRLTQIRLGAVIRGYEFLKKNSKDRYNKLLQT